MIFFRKTMLTLSFLMLAGCATNLTPVEFAADADPNAEISRLEQDMHSARTEQTDIAAPKSFKTAEKYLADAQKNRAKENSARDVLKDVGYGRAALDQAKKAQELSAKQYSDVMLAREAALAAGASSFQERSLKSADADFRDVTADYESQAIKQWQKGNTIVSFSDISQNKRDALKKEYSDVELATLKSKHLGRAQSMIEMAEKNSAASYAPKSLSLARTKYKDAETVISNNRQDVGAIEMAAREANMEAEKLLRVTNTARSAKGLSTEDIALDIENKKEAISEAEMTAEQRAQMIKERNSQLAGALNENQEFRRKAEFEETLAKAQKMFPENEADVTRQGDKILIRLKSGTFVSGRSDVGPAAYPVLGKVKELLSEVKAKDIVIEGHTDKTGSKEANMKLSKARAEAVATYLTNTTQLTPAQISTEGLGFDQPLAPNSTKKGRAQNRRVDIIVTPSVVR
ncbi:hypothetical protein CIK05_02275 [Bdellovibrio sp. qaytius]|nr:hypothetical protein CIK05_02275 [Bdellovibrio sp. qaytius]